MLRSRIRATTANTDLLRAAGSLASLAYGKARDAIIRRDLIDMAACTARRGRGYMRLHLPRRLHREYDEMTLLAADGDLTRPDQRTHTAGTAIPAPETEHTDLDRPWNRYVASQPYPITGRKH
jgi:hypothetical protein